MNKKALIAMSGGVDSSVAAFLMKEQGYECIGATMKLYQNDDIVINKDLLKRIDKESGEPSDTSDSIVCWPPIPDGWCINLDGKNHTISGLYINESGKAGLYASLGAGSFKNLTITDSFVKGGDNVGVLIGDPSYSTGCLCADNV